MALPAETERHKFVLIFLYWVGEGVRELVMLKGYCECFRKYNNNNNNNNSTARVQRPGPKNKKMNQACSASVS